MQPFIPGTASLVEEIDKKLIVVLRDGRKLYGVMRSFDQFANIVLESTVQRIYVDNKFGDVALGLFLIRGENVVLLGEVDEQAEAVAEDALLQRVSAGEIVELQRQQRQQRVAAARAARTAGHGTRHVPVVDEDAF